MVYLIPPGRSKHHEEEKAAILNDYALGQRVLRVGDWARGLPERVGERSAHSLSCRCTECRLKREHALATGTIHSPLAINGADSQESSARPPSRLVDPALLPADKPTPHELTAADRVAARRELLGAVDGAIERLRDHLVEDSKKAQARRETDLETRRKIRR
jgi:hypothetical protein